MINHRLTGHEYIKDNYKEVVTGSCMSLTFYRRSLGQRLVRRKRSGLSVCKVRTQDPVNFDEEVKSLLTAWRTRPHKCDHD